MTTVLSDAPAEGLRTLTVPDCWAEAVVARNPIRQRLVKAQVVSITGDDQPQAESSDGSWRVFFAGERYEGWELSLRCPSRRNVFVDGELCSWLGGRALTAPGEVLASYKDALSYVEEDKAAGLAGMRTPQLGSLHAVLAHWTTDSQQPATVVMPTGTGKTDAMVALLVAAQIPRLLVLVPSDALRTQISERFESLGVLQQFGAISKTARPPVVGRLQGKLTSIDEATQFAQSCNVIVGTPSSLRASDPEVQTALIGECSHLFVDEAHHVAAATWRSIRDQFKGRPIVQFTATPYREDGKRLGGRIIYAYPLRLAQTQGYFSSIRYRSILDFANSDRSIAENAVAQLQTDLAAGFDHLLMARVRRISRAHELLSLYEELAPELAPVVLDSSIGTHARKAAHDAIDSRNSRIIICVDMLGEGFDLPSLKVAAIHDPHKSLGVTLQFVGRFARVAGSTIGDATVFVGRPDSDFDPNLRRLYAEDADWNEVIQDLSELAVEFQQEVGEFEAGFNNLPEDVTLRNIVPKMSTVIYRTHCDDWNPDGVAAIYPEDKLLTFPVPINLTEHVTWFVTKLVEPVRWGHLDTVEQTTYELFVLYWDRNRGLLYINCSNTGSVYEALAKAVTSPDTAIVKGETVYRSMAQVTRLVPTNVGVLDIRNRSRRFSMHVGADVTEGFPRAEAQTKTQTNIFATGYEDGTRITIGASLKGRIWSYRVADSIKQWVSWCDHIGSKVIDEGIGIDEVMRGFIRPRVVESRPAHVPLAIEWPWTIYLSLTEELKVENEGRTFPLIDTDLVVLEHSGQGDIPFEVRTPDWNVRYRIRFSERGVSYEPEDDGAWVVTQRSRVTLSDFFEKHGLVVLFSDDVAMVPPGMLLQPDRDLSAFNRDDCQVLDWSQTNVRKESQGQERAVDSVQATVLRHLIASESWDLVIDDDGSGEIADIVALRIEGGELIVKLLHCKYSSEDAAGARVADLYEVCGQAQKCVRWRRDMSMFFQHLIRRERRRQERGTRSGLEVGTAEKIYELEEKARLLIPKVTIAIAQPGLSKERASDAQLHLLGCTQVYLYETAYSEFEVYCAA
jgi:superfamily II DNA or RNA helicase